MSVLTGICLIVRIGFEFLFVNNDITLPDNLTQFPDNFIC
jgi:hypothetical protein